MTFSSSQKPPIVFLCKKRTDEVLHIPRCTYSSLPVSFFLLFALSSLILPIRFLIYLPGTFTVTHHGHFFHYLCPFQKITDCPHRDLRCLFHRIAVHPCTDRWKCNRLETILFSQFQAVLLTPLQQHILIIISTMPDRSRRMKHIMCRQIVPFGNLGLTGITSA